MNKIKDILDVSNMAIIDMDNSLKDIKLEGVDIIRLDCPLWETKNVISKLKSDNKTLVILDYKDPFGARPALRYISIKDSKRGIVAGMINGSICILMNDPELIGCNRIDYMFTGKPEFIKAFAITTRVNLGIYIRSDLDDLSTFIINHDEGVVYQPPIFQMAINKLVNNLGLAQDNK